MYSHWHRVVVQVLKRSQVMMLVAMLVKENTLAGIGCHWKNKEMLNIKSGIECLFFFFFFFGTQMVLY